MANPRRLWEPPNEARGEIKMKFGRRNRGDLAYMVTLGRVINIRVDASLPPHLESCTYYGKKNCFAPQKCAVDTCMSSHSVIPARYGLTLNSWGSV